jgi:hypothetical protein
MPARKLKTSIIGPILSLDAASVRRVLRGRQGEIEEESEMVSKREVVPQDERSSETCLHCEINDLVEEYIEGQETVDIAEVAARMAESLIDLVLRAPEQQQAQLLAATISTSDKRSWKRPGRSQEIRIRCNEGRGRLPVTNGYTAKMFPVASVSRKLSDSLPERRLATSAARVFAAAIAFVRGSGRNSPGLLGMGCHQRRVRPRPTPVVVE